MTADLKAWSRWKVLALSFLTNFFLAPYDRKFVASLNLKGQEKVLEFGAGTGGASRHLAAALQRGGRLICTDISAPWQQATRHILHKYTNVEFKLGDDTAINLPAHSLDLVLVHFALRDLPPVDRQSALETLLRVLKPQGRLVLRESVHPANGLPAAEIESLLRRAGFRVLESRVGRVSPWRRRAYTGVLVQDTRKN